MKKKTKILSIALCGAAILGCGSIAAFRSDKASAATTFVLPQEYAIDSEYSFGQQLTVPAPESVMIQTGSTQSAAVSVVLEYPDGSAKSDGIYTLDKTGTYTLTYYNSNGVAATQSFVVNKNVYEVGADASASFSNALLDETTKQGIDVTLTDGNSFTFNKSINLNDYAGQQLDVCKIFPMFREHGNANPDASTVSIKIVDLYDQTKFVEFYVWCGEAGQGVYYMGGGTSEQVLTGLEQNRNRPHEMTEPYNGQLYKIHRPQRYQPLTAWGTGMASVDNTQLLTKHDGLSLIWDLSNHQLLTKTNNTLCLLTDVDSTEIYSTNAFDFDSFFTTGEVLLNVQAYNYATKSFRLGIESIFGMSGEALHDGKVSDTDAPDIFVDIETTENNAVYLQKGTPMVLPAITKVLDPNYYGKTSVKVYRNYGKLGQALVNVEDGVFVPELLGNYTAVYTATDAYGNEGKFIFDMIVLDKDNISYEPNPVDKLVAAKANLLPNIAVSGLNKDAATTVTVTAPDGTKTTLDYNGSGYEFIPAYTGTYTVSYLFKDNVYEETYSYQVTCVNENSAVFQAPFHFPKAFIKGASYTVAPVTAYTAGNGAFKENKATVSVSVDGGAYQTLSDAQMQAYAVTATKTLQFKASFNGSFVESEVYSVIDVGFGKKPSEKNYSDYMQGNYTAATLGENGLTYTFDGDASLQYINKISSANFQLLFSVNAEATEEITVLLRDARNPAKNYITYTYAKAAATTVVARAKQYVNGKLVFEGTVPSKHSTLSTSFSIDFSSLGTNIDGAMLKGVQPFDEDSALLEVYVDGMANGGEVTISRLNNQTFTTSIRESKPQLSYRGSNGAVELNSIYEIAPCYGNSVTSSVLTKDVKITVQAPDGSIVSSVDGVRLEGAIANKAYNVKLTQTGQYRVTYEVSCIGASRNNGADVLTTSDYYIINVSEGVAPNLSFKDGSNENTTVYITVGGTHNVKDFSVSDNVSPNEKIKVYTMILDKYFMLEEDGYNATEYVFKNVGEYIVYVVAYDELGNSSAIYYNVIVVDKAAE